MTVNKHDAGAYLNMEKERIVVPSSLQETLWRLEEVRRGFRGKSDAYVKEALQWILSRQGLRGAYSDFFMPTSQDLTLGVHLLTGEHIKTGAATRHILGEEALRTIVVWKHESSPEVKEALKGFEQILERGGKSGYYCCHTCTMAFLRTLAVVKPENWDRIIDKGLNRINEARTSNGRWRSFPFYYTLLTLSEIDQPSVHDELRHVRKQAEKLLPRYSRTDRISLFRKIGLEAACRKN